MRRAIVALEEEEKALIVNDEVVWANGTND